MYECENNDKLQIDLQLNAYECAMLNLNYTMSMLEVLTLKSGLFSTQKLIMLIIIGKNYYQIG